MKSRFKMLGLLSVFLLLFGGVALAQNATQVQVEISYPCDGEQDECDTGEAVSRADNGDKVNVYVTLLDASGEPATAGPVGESLTSLTATVSSTLGTIDANEFTIVTADAQTIAFGGDATARANIDYTDAIPGIDQVIVSVSSDPDPLVGNAEVNVVAPPAVRLVARTLRNASPPQNIYDPIPEQQDNGDAEEQAGFSVPVAVIADEGTGNPDAGLYTPDPALDGQNVIVRAYADYSVDGVAGGGVPAADIAEGYEEDPVGEATFTFQNGIASGTVQIDSAGPGGLTIVFTAEVDSEDNTISTALMNGAGVDLGDFTVDTVTVNPLSPDRLLIGSDPYGNGNLVMEAECYYVLDDNATVRNTEVFLVDSLDNAVNAGSDVEFSGTFGAGSTLDDQLTFGCTPGTIGGGTYSEGCTILDTNPATENNPVQGSLTVSDTELGSDSVIIQLVPGNGGMPDLTVEVDRAGDTIAASDQVVLTLNSVGDVLPVVNGDILEITAENLATGDAQLLSTSDFASATTALQLPAGDENDDEEDGVQLPAIRIYGPCSIDIDQNVRFTVTDTSRCDIEAESDDINDIQPGEADKLAIVELADGVETESELDDDGFVGTNPVVIDTAFIADGATINPLLDAADSCDGQVWDAYDNVLEDEPELTCTSESGLGIVDYPDTCEVDVVYVTAAAGTTDTITCDADIVGVETRSFSIAEILAEAPGGVGEATAVEIRQEGPQERDGEQTVPCGEAIIQVSANGTLASARNIEIFFAEGSVDGAELRALNSNQPLTLPFPVTLNTGDVRRFVVYAPDSGQVNVRAADLGSEPLTPGALDLPFCGIPECTVTVTCEPNELDCEDCATCTAATTCNDQSVEGTYTWDVSGGALNTGNTGNSIEVCENTPTEAGTITVTATDTANEEDGSTTVVDTCGAIPGECIIDVLPETLPKSHWLGLYPVGFRIETAGFDIGPLGLNVEVAIDCETDGMGLVRKAILRTGKVVIPSFGANTTVILQTALIWQAALTQSLEMESETCTYTLTGVDDLGSTCSASDTFELDYLSVLGIPLDE